MMVRCVRWLSGTVLLALVLAAAAAALPQQQGSVDLLNQADGQWDGPGEAQGGSNTGTSIAGLGDVFHDGRAAVAIGAPEANPGGRLSAGSVYVVAGQSGTGPVDLTALIGRGYRIDGNQPGDQLGFSLAAITLRSGHPALALGAPYASPNGRAQAGVVYIVDLTRLRGNLDLSSPRLPRAVVGVLSGPAPCAELGYALAPGPRARGRGTTLLAGAPGDDPSGCPAATPQGPTGGNAGAAYLVGVGALTRRTDLAHPGSAAATLAGAASGDRAGAAVSGVAGTGAFMIGAPYASPFGRAGAGAVYLLHQVRLGAVIRLSAPPAGSTVFAGAMANDDLGFALTSIQGFTRGAASVPDLVLGAPQATPLGRTEAGRVYVVAGLHQPAAVDLSTARGVGVIDGADSGDEAGYSLSALGSIDGSGRPSLGIGAPFVDSQTGQDRIDDGAAYVLFGDAGPASLDLAHLRAGRGFVALGARNSDEAGTAVAGVQNESGDGRADVLIGAPYAEDAFGGTPTEGGAVYVLFGWGRPVLSYPRHMIAGQVGRAIMPLRPRLQATGHPTFTVSPALPRGLTLGHLTGVIRGVPRRRSPPTSYQVQMSDAAGVASATVTISVR